MNYIRNELINDLDLKNPCPVCIIDCCHDECEWGDDEGNITDEPHHRETILNLCYEKGGIDLYAKWKEKLKFGLDITDEDDYPELWQLIDHCLILNQTTEQFEKVIAYCLKRNYDIYESQNIKDPYYMDKEKNKILLELLEKYKK